MTKESEGYLTEYYNCDKVTRIEIVQYYPRNSQINRLMDTDPRNEFEELDDRISR